MSANADDVAVRPRGQETGHRTEWAELWPDGKVRPVHRNATPVGVPTKPPPYAHKGTLWVKRIVTYAEWEPFDVG